MKCFLFTQDCKTTGILKGGDCVYFNMETSHEWHEWTLELTMCILRVTNTEDRPSPKDGYVRILFPLDIQVDRLSRL